MSLTIWQLDPASLTPYYNFAICDALADMGHDIRYVTSNYLYDRNLPQSDKYTTDLAYFKGLDSDWLLKVSILRKVLRGIMYPFNHRQVLTTIQKNSPDIVHLQWSRLPRFDRPFIQAIKDLNIPIVHTIHNVKSSFAPPSMIRQLGEIYMLCDRLMLHTQANQREFLQTYPQIPAEKTTVIPLLQSDYPYPIPKFDKRQLKQEFGFSPDVTVLLLFGIIRHYKGVDLLLSAFEQIQQTHNDVRLLIAGKPESKQDVDIVRRAKSNKQITVHDHFIPSEDLWKYFYVSDLAIFPYRTVTQSAALIQAMDFGLPVIVTDVGGFPETVQGNGWVVPSENVMELANIMQYAINHPDELAQKGKQSKSLVEQFHTPKSVARQLTDLYMDVLDDTN